MYSTCEAIARRVVNQQKAENQRLKVALDRPYAASSIGLAYPSSAGLVLEGMQPSGFAHGQSTSEPLW